MAKARRPGSKFAGFRGAEASSECVSSEAEPTPVVGLPELILGTLQN